MSPDEAPPQYDDVAETPEVPRMPWEEPGRGLAERVWATLGSAFHPVRDVARVSHGEVAPAARFAALTAIPVMALAGVMPCTRLLLFGSSLELKIKGEPSTLQLALDVLAGAGLGVAILATGWLLSCWNYVALARFASDPQLAPANPTRAAWRVSLYRAWLLPAAVLILYTTLWIGPTPNEARARLLDLAFVVAPCVVQMLHFSAAARYLGASALAAVPVSFAPVLVYWLALNLGYGMLMQLGYLPAEPMPMPQ